MTRSERKQKEALWQLGELVPENSLHVDRPFPEGRIYVPDLIELESGPIDATAITAQFGHDEQTFFDATKTAVAIRFDGPCIIWGLRTIHSRQTALSPRAQLLDQFVRLCDAPEADILRFVQKWGPMKLCRHGLPNDHFRSATFPGLCSPLLLSGSSPRTRDGIVRFVEPLWYWRRLARMAVGLLNVAAEVNQGRCGHISDWKTACLVMFPDAMVDETEARSVPFETTGENARHFGRSMVIELANSWLLHADLHPTLSKDNGGALHIESSSALFGHLAMNLALSVVKEPGVAICSNCGKKYPTTRRPDPTRRNYCPRDSCRRLAAWRDAARAKRSRLREQRSD